MEKESIHAEHRKRQRKKFAEYGPEHFTDIEILEFLLFYAIPRGNTNQIAHALLDHFLSFRAVLEADQQELTAVEGVGPASAALICLVRELHRRYSAGAFRERPVLKGSREIGDYLQGRFRYRNEETAMLLCLDGGSRPISCRVLNEGSGVEVSISVRAVVDIALRDKAARVVLAHNHLSGTALPSNADILTTRQLWSTLRSIGVDLADHLIFSGEDYISLRESGLFQV